MKRTFISDQDIIREEMETAMDEAKNVPAVREGARAVYFGLDSVPRTFDVLESRAGSFRNKILSNMSCSIENVTADLVRLLSMIHGIEIVPDGKGRFIIITASATDVIVTVDKSEYGSKYG
jgi:hypothetical protein